MPQYRRTRLAGGTYFFTVNLADRNSRILTDQFDLLSETVNKVKKRRPFQIHGWVVLPDHLHVLWTLPKNDYDYSRRWWAIKAIFARKYREKIRMPDIPVWQHRFWEHTVRDQLDFNNHMDYIHINPMKHGYVRQVKNWQYSSFHYLVSRGFYSESWGGSDSDLLKLDLGE